MHVSPTDRPPAPVAAPPSKSSSVGTEVIEAAEPPRHGDNSAAFADTSAIGVQWLSRDGTIEWANAALLRLLGNSRAEYIGRSVTEFLAAAEEATALVAALRDGRKLHEYEAELRAHDGSTRFVLIDSTVLWEASRSGRTQWFVRDITEKKRAEAALAAAREQLETQLEDLRQLHEMNSRLSASLDLRTMLEEVLHAALSVHHAEMGLLSLCTPDGAGLVPGVSVGLRPEFLRNVEYVRCGIGACGAAMQRRKRIIIEDVDEDPLFASLRAAAKVGGFRAVHTTPLITRNDKIIGTLSVHFRQPYRPSVREIRLLDLYAQQAADLIENARLRENLSAELQERRQAEAALRANERRLRLAVEMARLSVYDWDPATGALNWDTRLKAMWGLPPDAPVDYDVFLQGLHPADRAYVEGQIARAVDPTGDGIYEAEFRVIGIEDGVERWVMARGQTSFEDGKPISYVGGAMDVTERRRTEEQLENTVAERTAQLAASNARMEDYVYTIAHDIRAPLRAMQSFAGLLLEDYASQLDATAQDYARRVVRAGESLDAMVVDLLAYGRVMRADMALDSVDLGEAWAAAIAQHEHTIRQRAAVIELDPTVVKRTVRAHETTLVQVFANLLSNALKFVAPGTAPRVRIHTENAGDVVRLWVADNGIGIAPEYHEKIFRVFERLHGPAYTGTGIGLAIVRTGIERMGGRLGLESEVGAGTRFWIDLPPAE